MHRHIAALVLISIVVVADTPAHALTPAYRWSQRFGGTTSDQGYCVAVDGIGNVVMAGTFSGTAAFGGSPLVSAGGSDVVIAKYDGNGAHLWSQRFGGAGEDFPRSVALDASGNVFVTGVFEATVDFGGGGLISSGGKDIFLAKYDANGAHLWSRRFGSTGDDYGQDLTLDESGNVFLTGGFQDSVDFGGGPLVSAGNFDIVLARYDTNGAHLWSRRFGDTLTENGMSVAVDGNGNVFMTGYFMGTVDFGGGPLGAGSGTGIFLAKYDASGVHMWSHGHGSTIGGGAGYGVAVDSSGNAFLAGIINGRINLGGGLLVSAGGSDIFLAKYDPSGAHLWSTRFGTTFSEKCYSVSVDEAGNAVVTGWFEGTVDFGGGPLTASGNTDVFLAKYDTGGAHMWSTRFGSERGDAGWSVVVDGFGNTFLTGDFTDTVDFGGGPLTTAGSFDAYLLKVAGTAAEPVAMSITDIGNDQGRQVKIRFNRSGHDDPESPTPIATYEAYRREDPTPAASSAVRDPAGLSARALRADGWTQVGDVAAHGEPVYSIVVPTLGDSTIALGQYFSAFYVRAATDNTFMFFDSPIDSGYSLDNLSPGVPVNLAYASGSLTWDESPAADFDFYTVYGSNTDSFGTATVVDYSVAPAMNVLASPYVFYFVTATDFSGNEGKAARVNTLSGVGGTPRRYVLSVSNFPNPFNPRTTVSYTVPSRGHVRVSVYDARGALIATLFDGERNAGAFNVDWDGRAAGASVTASGVYFARIEHASGTRSKKMVLLK